MRRFESLRRRSDFIRLRRRGRIASAPDLTVYSSPGGVEGSVLVGISIGKSVGKAVVRNALRRRLQSILDLSLGDTPRHMLIVPRPSAALVSFSALNDQLRRALAVKP